MRELSFARQFLVFSLVILMAGMLTIGIWIQAEVKRAVIGRTAGVTALYVDSFVSPVLQDLDRVGEVTADMRTALDRLLSGTPLGRHIVSFKVWLLDGTIAYSVAPELIGQRFEISDDLARAADGEVVSHLTDLTEPENEYERGRWDRLIETYAPVRVEGSGRVVAVAEFYQLPDELLRDIRSAQSTSWVIVGIATIVMYLMLAGIVRRASSTITAQRLKLQRNVTELSETLDENRRLHERTRRAAERTTALNERYLHRISADLHDGPAQDIALALLRMESVTTEGDAAGSSNRHEELGAVRIALDSALTDLRGIARGLRLPAIDDLSTEEIARRVVEDFGRLTGVTPNLECRELPDDAPGSIKITLYRVLHEALANSYRHAGGASATVRLEGFTGSIAMTVTDAGPGFDVTTAIEQGSLGLAGMRERIEMLGGTFEVDSGRAGTRITVHLPIPAEGPTDA